MIKSKEEYRQYLLEDRKANMGSYGGGILSCMHYYICLIGGAERAKAYSFCKALRRYEYVQNCLPNNFVCRAIKILFKYLYHRREIRCNVTIVPNTIGYGLKIQHIIGGGCVIVANSIGNYFSVRQYTTVGKANGDACPIIGNNVTLGANVTIIGNINIGDNCIIGAGAVVVKDVPADSIVVGNPGRIIGKIQKNKQY